jgi:hypothetical protein
LLLTEVVAAGRVDAVGMEDDLVVDPAKRVLEPKRDDADATAATVLLLLLLLTLSS